MPYQDGDKRIPFIDPGLRSAMQALRRPVCSSPTFRPEPRLRGRLQVASQEMDEQTRRNKLASEIEGIRLSLLEGMRRIAAREEDQREPSGEPQRGGH